MYDCNNVESSLLAHAFFFFQKRFSALKQKFEVFLGSRELHTGRDFVGTFS